MILTALGGIILLFVLLALGTLYWGGAFSKIEVGEIDSPEFHMIYLEHRGAYNKVKELDGTDC